MTQAIGIDEARTSRVAIIYSSPAEHDQMAQAGALLDRFGVLYDESGDLARAQSHYSDFLAHAGPEHGSRLTDVRRRLDAMAPKLDR